MTHIRRKLPPGDHSWWAAYDEYLADTGFSMRSRQVLDMDADYIVRNGVFPPSGSEDEPAIRAGLVMGAVQSGKTASMLAVTTKAIDAGVDCVVILAGTRISLWRQTLERFAEQVDTFEDAHLLRVLVPDRRLIASGATTALSTLYAVPSPLIARMIKLRRPLIAVVMKHVAHLERFAHTLDRVYEQAHLRGGDFRLLVIDDEADDSSVIDSAAPAGNEADVQEKQVPLRIVDLWASRRSPLDPKIPELRATYLAYTATPQANFLQDPQNPLAPRDFVASLRTPGSSGDYETRSSSYRDPAGPLSSYTGGEVYYRLLEDVPLCVEADESEDSLKTALRAYLVASAIRLMRAKAPGPLSAERQRFDSRVAATLPPMSMLIHPSSAMEDHFAVADRVLNWSAALADGTVMPDSDASRGRRLGTAGLVADLDDNTHEWKRWLSEYARAASIVHARLGLDAEQYVPGEDQWDAVRKLLVTEVIPGTRVAVINSDENADDRPNFSPWFDGTAWRSPKNLSTIFVSGNVMSRGLTLEGLTTTLFLRTSGTDLADTQMQMQRWFGYRAKIIDLCRVFASGAQIGLFHQYHENDEALRRDVLAAMIDGQAPPNIQILQGRSFRATGRISNVQGIPLFPGPRPFVRHLTPPAIDDPNLALMAELFRDEPSLVPVESGSRGLVAREPKSLLETSRLLERLRYSDHGPGPDSYEASRWASVANHAGLVAGDSLLPLYRAPHISGGRDLGLSSPYAIAAYLRLWAACVERLVPGMTSTDEPPVPWTLVDLQARQLAQPRFWIALRFGEGHVLDSGPLAELPVPARTMARDLDDGLLAATWGARGDGPGGIVGDDQFDTLVTGQRYRLTSSGARPAGSDGLLLFHLVDRGEGLASLAVGLSIPVGGPDHVQARVRHVA